MIAFVKDEIFPNIVPVRNARILKNGDVKAEGQTFSKYHVISVLPDASGEHVASELAAVERTYSLASTALKDGLRDHVARCFKDVGISLGVTEPYLSCGSDQKKADPSDDSGTPFMADHAKIQPYDEGLEAAECGSYRTTCPYDFDTPEGRLWIDGYRKGGGED